MNRTPGGKKRVLFLVDKSGFGGIQTIASTLMNHRVSDDIDLLFYFVRNINDRFGMADIARETVFYSRSSRRYSLRPLVELVRIVRRHRIDILHANGNKSILMGAVLKLLFPRLRLCAHEHGGVFDYRWWYALLVRLFRERIDLFVSLSAHRKEFLLTRCRVAPEKVRVLYNFIDPARIGLSRLPSDEPPRGKKREGEPLVIGYLGGLSRIKGCDVLIRAISLLRGRMAPFRVIIAGDGPARGELERLVGELGLADIISFLGYVSDPASVYADFDMMVIPSRSEAGPMCLYEAWAMGLPVVASNAPVLNEIVRDRVTGLLFASEDAEDLTEIIQELSGDTRLRERLIAESTREVANHSIEKYLVNLREIYESL